MLLKNAKSVPDLIKRGLGYMSKNGFAGYEISIQGQRMCFGGMRVKKLTEEEIVQKEKEEKEKAEQDKKKGLKLLYAEKVNENVPLERTNFKIDITKYLPNFKPRKFIPDKLPENLLQTEAERIEALEKKLPTLSKGGKMRGESDEEKPQLDINKFIDSTEHMYSNHIDRIIDKETK